MLLQHFPTLDIPPIAEWLAQRATDSTATDRAATELSEPLSPGVVLVLLPEAESASIPALQASCREQGLALLGACFPAILTAAGFATQGGVLAYVPGARGVLLDAMDGNASQAGVRLADAVAARLEEAHRQVFLIFDGMLPNISTLLLSLFERMRTGLRYTGVNAGSETFQSIPCLFDNERCLANGAIALLMDGATQMAVEHGYPVSRSLMRATSTVGNRIDKLDGEPAMTAYQRLIAAEYGVDLTPDNFYHYAVHYPFGLISSLDVLVRIPVGFNADGSIFCVGEVPPNSMLRLLRAPAPEESHCLARLADGLPASETVPLLAFYCAGRRMHLGDAATAEVHQLAQQAGPMGVLGALSLGEIGTDPELGMPVFHNAALVCLR